MSNGDDTVVGHIKGGLTPETPDKEFNLVISPEEAKLVSKVPAVALLASMYVMNKEQFIKMVETWDEREFKIRRRVMKMAEIFSKIRAEIKATVMYDPPEMEANGYKRIVVDESNPIDVQYSKYWIIAQYLVSELTTEDMVDFPVTLSFVNDRYK